MNLGPGFKGEANQNRIQFNVGDHKPQQFSKLFFSIACFYIVCLLITNFVAGRLISIFGVTLSAAVLLFPVTYIIDDLLTEVYGFQLARLVIWLGFAANLFMSFFFLLVMAMPSPSFWEGGAAYRLVLGFTPRMVVASLIAYFAGEFSNAVILSYLKRMTEGKWLWIRTIGSTIVGEGLDSILVIMIAFVGQMSWRVMGEIMVANYIWKVGYETIATPLTYAAVKWVKQMEHSDVYDEGIRYNPW